MTSPSVTASRFVLSALLLVLAGPPARSAASAMAEVPARLQRFVDDNTLSGAVTLVARHHRVLAFGAVGLSDLGTRRPMHRDDLFWIASMTKPMTAVAVLMLQDEGKLSVSDPVEKYLPEFAGQWMLSEKSDTQMTLKRPSRAITLRDLLTHTSGLGEVSPPREDCSLAELVMAYAQRPLRFEPGSRWEYCNAGINSLGRVVEVVSGTPYAEFMQTRVFGPLQMKDTTFWPTHRQLKRLARSYQLIAGSGLQPVEIYFLKGPLDDRRRTAFPAGGLFSTAPDVARFYQMMLNRGRWHKRQLLSEAAVTEMTRTQTADLTTGFTNGMSWGLGFQVVKAPQGVTSMLSQGTFGHGGAYGTQSWADPERDLIYVLMIQRANLPNGDDSEVRRAFQEAVAAAPN